MQPRKFSDNKILAQRRRASKEITAGIEEKINQLHAFSARKRAFEFTFFISLYALGAIIASRSQDQWLFAAIGVLLMGIALNSLGIFIHEGLHGLLAGNPRMNHLLSFFVGVPILISATAYEVTHLNHHCELGQKLDYGTYRQHTRNPALIWLAYFLQLFFGCIFYILLIPFLGFKSAPRRERMFIIAEYLTLFSIYTVAFINLSHHALLLFWLYPLLVMTILTNIRGLASHALGDVEDIYLSSRTVQSSRFVSFLFLYENYHLEHHIFPRVPSYNLPAVHNLIWDRLPYAVYAPSYLSFLANFFKAASKSDLSPLGIIVPRPRGNKFPI